MTTLQPHFIITFFCYCVREDDVYLRSMFCLFFFCWMQKSWRMYYSKLYVVSEKQRYSFFFVKTKLLLEDIARKIILFILYFYGFRSPPVRFFFFSLYSPEFHLGPNSLFFKASMRCFYNLFTTFHRFFLLFTNF